MITKTLLALLGLIIGTPVFAAAPYVQTVPQGGTGWGNIQANTLLTGNGTNKLATTSIGSGLTLSGGVLSASSASIDPFTHPAAGQSATTSTMLFFGNASTTQFTATSSIWFTALSQGFNYTGTGGSQNTIASSSVKLSWFNNDAGFVTSAVTAVTGTWPIISSGGNTPAISFAWATTTQPASSNLVVSNGAAGFYGVGTSTLSATSPLTGSFTQVGSGGSLGIQVGNASQNGYISNTDWTAFNNKQAPGFQISTSSNIAAPQVAYFTGANPTSLGSVATGTITCSGSTSCATTGLSILGGNLTITGTGGSGTVTSITAGASLLGGAITTSGTLNAQVGTSSIPTINPAGIAYWTAQGDTTSAAKLGSTATGTVSCTGNISCTNFFGIGSASSIAFTGTLPIASGGTNSAATPATNSLLYFNGTGIVSTSSTPLWVGAINATSTTQNSGFATTTPWAMVSINPNGITGPAFAVGSSTKTVFLINNGGFIGIASTSPSTQQGFSIGTSTVIGAAQFAGYIASSSAVAASYTVNWDTGNTQRFIVNQTSAFIVNATSSNPKDGGHYILQVCQDPTGGRAVTFATPGQLRWTNGTTSVTTTASQCSIIGMIFDVTYGIYRVVGSSTPVALF